MVIKKVVVLGGGNGTSIVLRALKAHTHHIDLSAVISVADSGSSSGVLRKQYGMIPPSDLMRAVIALSAYDHAILRDIFYKNRLEDGPLMGHSLGNLILAWAHRETHDIRNGIQALQTMVKAAGRVYPVSTTPVDLCVELTDGTIVRGEGAIDEPAYDRSLRIAKAWLEPNGVVDDEARNVIESADAIILGPSSVYTSIISTLLVGGVREAIDRSKASIVYVPSTYLPVDGETGPTTLSGQVSAIESALPRAIDSIVVNTQRLAVDPRLHHDIRLEDYSKDVENLPTHHCVKEDLSDPTERMNLKKFGEVLMRIIASVS
ncbi:YvcK family protein [Candidatus Uhrbacteria bacterium]|nr:YvcK family protein [Candidatus Uhrbacteria bacterium]